MTVCYDKLFGLMERHKMTSSSLMRQANISGNIISRLKHNEYVSLETVESICRVFSCRPDDILAFSFPIQVLDKTDASFIPTQTVNIQNRRYLGNKFKLLDFIRGIVTEHCTNVSVVADIFSGTGAVASTFENTDIITNDLLHSNYLCNVAWFGSEVVRLHFLSDLITEYNQISAPSENYMTQNFSNTYFSMLDCAKIGFIREDIEKKYQSHIINERERAILVAALIYAMDKIANTCGHYDSWRRGIIFDRHLFLAMPNVPVKNNKHNRCFNENANDLVKHITADLIYIDPPYNSRQYSDTYHVLENVSKWQKPPVHGVARKFDRTKIKSDYCTSKATAVFADLIENCNARYILLSYNNMAHKGNERSNARISDEDILHILSKRGKINVFSKKYRAFTTGKSDIRENEERLFLCSLQ